MPTRIPPRPHRLGNVLQRLRTQIVESYIDLAADLPLCVIGYTDAPCLCDSFEMSRDIDAIAEDVVIVDNDVADVNAERNSITDPIEARRCRIRKITLMWNGLPVTGMVYSVMESSNPTR